VYQPGVQHTTKITALITPKKLTFFYFSNEAEQKWPNAKDLGSPIGKQNSYEQVQMSTQMYESNQEHSELAATAN
jgi:hypothetical protein